MDTLLTESLNPQSENAWRHGLYARSFTVPQENLHEFEQLRDALVAEWRPRTATAWVLVDHLAKLQWRLSRAMEAEVIKVQKLQNLPMVPLHPGQPATAEMALAWDTCRQESVLHRMQVFQMRLERSIHRTIGQLITLRKSRVKQGGLRSARARKESPKAPANPTLAPEVQK